MGCHTWFYKKIEVTEDQVRKDVIKYLKEEITFYNKLINNRNEIDKDLLDAYPEFTKEFGLYYKPIYERRLQMIQNGLCKVAMYNKYKSSDLNSVYYFDKNTCTMYINTDDLPHNLFRRSDYPNDKLFSLEQTLKYLEDNKDIIYYTCRIDDDGDKEKLKEESIQKLKEFWNQYPNGMINFG